MQVFVVSYETDESTYKLYLLGKDQSDAMTYLKMRVGDLPGYRMNNFESREEIHMITPQLIDMLQKETPVPVVEHRLVCPWCNEDKYETNHALKMHIVKTHADTKKEDKKPKKED
jgi:hypothetical protein